MEMISSDYCLHAKLCGLLGSDPPGNPEDLLRHARRVLALVVENLVPWNDLSHGERPALQHRDGQLPAGHELLDHYLVVVLPGQLYRRVIVGGPFHHSE